MTPPRAAAPLLCEKVTGQQDVLVAIEAFCSYESLMKTIHFEENWGLGFVV